MSYTIFAMDSNSEPVAHLLPGEEGQGKASANGHRVDAEQLIDLLDELLDLEGVSYCEVHDGSCSRQA
jgi:hypothetical protein